MQIGSDQLVHFCTQIWSLLASAAAPNYAEILRPEFHGGIADMMIGRLG